ncbi:Heavy metal-associated isoprenylated plant protein 39 [Sesamum alatum]|uniref:Heavy metal-associated isoprenylated plant protein 39 n=1 Tax=Sesamum alatum TaxID=300844 RepID=A0AAE1YJV5_9LAMI|nr:Heavy metal-associated isoprenylated plant protein 39 [Sesamum alatum]
MSQIYDNWERLVAAVLHREEFRRLCHQQSRSPSIRSSSSDFSFSSPLHDVESLNFSGPGAAAQNSSSQQQTHRPAAFISESVSTETVPINADPLPTFMYKVVLKMDVNDDREIRKAFQIASSFYGLQSVSLDRRQKKFTLVGNFDPIAMVQKLRKSLLTDIVSVGPTKVG